MARTLRRLFHAAHELGRVPMVFGFPCDAPWLARGPHALLGVYDHRVVKHGGLCYPAPGGQRCWWDTHVYAFEVPQDTVAPRTLRAFDEARAHGASHEVHLRHLPELTQPVNDKLRQDCHKARAARRAPRACVCSGARPCGFLARGGGSRARAVVRGLTFVCVFPL